MRASYRSLLIALFAIGILLGLVFGGGVVLGRNSAPVPTPIAPAGGAAAAAGGAATGATGASGGGAAAPNLLAGQTIGTVTGVEGDGFTVRALDGRTLTMAASLSTRVTNTVSGTMSDLRPGSLVAISPGPPDAQGRTIATSVLILPAALAASLPSPSAGAPSGASGASGARPSATAGAAASSTPTR
jgi:hypothetical protein